MLEWVVECFWMITYANKSQRFPIMHFDRHTYNTEKPDIYYFSNESVGHHRNVIFMKEQV